MADKEKVISYTITSAPVDRLVIIRNSDGKYDVVAEYSRVLDNGDIYDKQVLILALSEDFLKQIDGGWQAAIMQVDMNEELM